MTLTFDLQERWQQLVLVLDGGNRIRETFAIVERLEESLEAVIDQRHFDGCRRTRTSWWYLDTRLSMR